MSTIPDPLDDEIEQTLHDFAVSLHEYANGRANGLVYREELDKTKSAIRSIVEREKQNAVNTALDYIFEHPDIFKRQSTRKSLREIIIQLTTPQPHSDKEKQQ